MKNILPCRHLTWLVAVVLLLSPKTITAQMAFNAQGKLKIMQFTDLHYDAGRSESAMTRSLIISMLEKEMPDLAVFTGDLVLGDEVEKGWREIGHIMEQKKTPWVAIFGNHDGECNVPRAEIYQIVKKMPYNISPSSTEQGVTDFVLAVKSSVTGQTAALLYFFDSNAYAPTYLPGAYGWVTHQQVTWYRHEATKYQTGNGSLPALAFLHIPLMEFARLDRDAVTGHWDEDVSSPGINTGLFAAMVESRDVMGIFAGHDHNNDYIGVLCDIALAYGRCSGYGGYGDLRQGARVIEMVEGKFAFDTWIATPSWDGQMFRFRNEGTSSDHSNGAFLKATIPAKIFKQGLRYTYYEGHAEAVSDIANLKIKKTGTAAKVDLSMASTTDHFAVEFEGYIQVPADDVYRFYVTSDDGALITIDGRAVVNNDGSHSVMTTRGTIALAKGYHHINIQYFEDHMGSHLEVGMASASVRETQLLPDWLYCD
ncbi:MAG: PA14 domain-containing protein [Breznakibacter sp.]